MSGGRASVTVRRVELASIIRMPGMYRERLVGNQRIRAAGFADPLAARRFAATRIVLRTLLGLGR